jgi:hypothetical protein
MSLRTNFSFHRGFLLAMIPMEKLSTNHKARWSKMRSLLFKNHKNRNTWSEQHTASETLKIIKSVDDKKNLKIWAVFGDTIGCRSQSKIATQLCTFR